MATPSPGTMVEVEAGSPAGQKTRIRMQENFEYKDSTVGQKHSKHTGGMSTDERHLDRLHGRSRVQEPWLVTYSELSSEKKRDGSKTHGPGPPSNTISFAACQTFSPPSCPDP
ncbi:hypothetical protein LUU34_01393100 [Aix galericulata]|nr:hypothetical protein LUU34_01393100 [Aix galericulata]